jgi:hypothetical protein
MVSRILFSSMSVLKYSSLRNKVHDSHFNIASFDGHSSTAGSAPVESKKRTQHASDESTTKQGRISHDEHNNRRREKLKELKLQVQSPLPMFAHKLTLTQLKKHPELDNWHMHRQAMENDILEQWQLPNHFQSIQGEFRFPKKVKSTSRLTNRSASEEAEARDRQKQFKTVQQRLQVLKLASNSAIPIFAQTLSIDELMNHKLIHEWHEYREKIEKGEISQKDLPVQFKSKGSGKLVFKGISGTRKMQEAVSVSNDVEADLKGRRLYQQQERRAKMKILHLKKGSALPIFAHLSTADAIQSHQEYNDWHRYRQLLAAGEITIHDLPEHFKPTQGSLRFLTRGGPYKVKSKPVMNE